MKKKPDLYSVLIILLIPILLTGFSKDKRGPYRNYVALVSMDGFRWDYPAFYGGEPIWITAENNVDIYNLICKRFFLADLIKFSFIYCNINTQFPQ